MKDMAKNKSRERHPSFASVFGLSQCRNGTDNERRIFLIYINGSISANISVIMIKILIADDHSVVRAGLRQILSGVTDMTVVDEASSAYEAIDKIRKNDYSVIVLDIAMPGKSGLDALK